MASRKRRNKRAIAMVDFSADRTWPSWCARLMKCQEQVESVAAFLYRRRMATSVDVIASTAQCSKDDVARLVALLPEHMELRWKRTIANNAEDSYALLAKRTDSASADSETQLQAQPVLELLFKSKRAFTKGNIAKRKQALNQAIQHHIERKHREFTAKHEDQAPAVQGQEGVQRHAEFNRRSVRSPSPVQVESAQEQEERASRAGQSKQYVNYTGTCRKQPRQPGTFAPRETLDHLLRLPLAKGHSLHVETIPPRAARYGDLNTPLPHALQQTLKTMGITRLFSHQAEGINAARGGAHVMISTATSSGKSLVYHLPTMEALLAAPSSSVALYIFPTKALAQDQLRSIREFIGSGWIGDAVRPACLDADTPQGERRSIMSAANLILTNPDLLHATLLPKHREWHRVFRSLRFVVIDEAHMYRGAFGSHVALVVRRLLRICCHYNNPNVQFICSTATLANPRDHFRRLVPLVYPGRSRLCVVDQDGSPSGSRVFVLWNPIQEQERGAGRGQDKPWVDSSTSRFQADTTTKAAATAATSTATVTSTTTSSSSSKTGLTGTPADHLSAGLQGASLSTAHTHYQTGRIRPIGIHPPTSTSMAQSIAKHDALQGPLSEQHSDPQQQRDKETVTKQRPAAHGGLPTEQFALAISATPTTSSQLVTRLQRPLPRRGPASPAKRTAGMTPEDKAAPSLHSPPASAPLSPRKRAHRTSAALSSSQATQAATSAFSPPRPHAGQPTEHRQQQRQRRQLKQQPHPISCDEATKEPRRRRHVSPPSSSSLSTSTAARGSQAYSTLASSSPPVGAARHVRRRHPSPSAFLAHVERIATQLEHQDSVVDPLGDIQLPPLPSAQSNVTLHPRREGRSESGSASGKTADTTSGKRSNTHQQSEQRQGAGAPNLPRSPETKAKLPPPQPHASPAAATVSSTFGPFTETIEIPGDVRVKTAGREERHISSAILHTALILAALVKQQVRTLTFAKVRKVAELVLKYTRHDLKHTAPHLVTRVKSYRAGYTKEERRALERALFSGEILGTTATNALELGVDIGSLDATVLLGFPGSIASMWQQAGRSGRGTHDALTILILFNSPLDQYYHRHPHQLFNRKFEAAVCDPSNPYVLREHLICAAAELPLTLLPQHLSTAQRTLGFDLLQEDAWCGHALELTDLLGACSLERYRETFAALEDILLFGPTAASLVQTLQERGVFMQTREGFTIRLLDSRPSLQVNLRSVEQENIAVYQIPEMKKIDEVDLRHAMWEVYEGAIFLHQGNTFLITHYDRDELLAHAKPVTVDYFTRPRDFTNVDVINVMKRDARRGVFWGSVQVTISVWGYHKIRERTLEFFETVDLILDPLEYKTRGFWIDVHPSVKDQLLATDLDVTSSIHGACHAIKNCLPIHVLCDLNDIDCEHSSPFQLRVRPLRLVFYDTKPGGIGVSFAGFEMITRIARTALELLQECACNTGCPKCIHDFGCSEYNERTSKAGALIVLQDVCERMQRAPLGATE